MKFIGDVSPDKLRGGFYSPPQLVDDCYWRIADLLGTSRPMRILEPSAGDGAFIRGIRASQLNPLPQKSRLTCVELVDKEAAKCRDALRAQGLDGEVIQGSFLSWARQQEPCFDAVVGNPPFVRYQFVPKSQRADADWLFRRFGKQLDGVSNLWIPIVLVSLELLRTGGAFSMVLPGELFATKSAGLVRSELVRHFRNLQVDLYPRGSFQNILQDTIVISGQRCIAPALKRGVRFVEHSASGDRVWAHRISDSKESWTRYLLGERELRAFDAARSLPEIHCLSELASIGVSIVTGANEFFTVDDATLKRYELERWARPLLARTAEIPGLICRRSDHANGRKSGKRAWILDFCGDLPDPTRFAKPRAYLQMGERQKLHTRYKCRIRTPWFRVPDVRYDDLMMSKRAHQFHRLLLNQAKVHTTDTIYRGRMKKPFDGWRDSLVAGFHNSLTILSSELEGRTYGGGVLELVPSEIGRLAVPLVDAKQHLPALDQICRDAGGQLDAKDTLMDATDDLLSIAIPDLKPLLTDLRSARVHLRQRRLLGE